MDIVAALKLKPREASVINQAIASRVNYGIDNTIIATDKGTVNAARRMIERGYLTKGDAEMTPPAPWDDWPQVRFTEANREKILADAAAAAKS